LRLPVEAPAEPLVTVPPTPVGVPQPSETSLFH
jgi:hypothetical protein